MKAKPWERRLKDLALILDNCFNHYFEPELFRLNLNQFLQTSRTVTFIIQKNKEDIPQFDEWYKDNIQQPLMQSPLMKWAKDSRNKIEKQGDLEMLSTASAKLIFSYDDAEDMEFLSCNIMLSINIKRLVRIARKDLPTGVLDASAIKVERRWVADSLPDWELLHALTTIYSRLYDICSRLSQYIEVIIDKEIPTPSSFDLSREFRRKVMYVKLNDMRSFSVNYRSIGANPGFKLPNSIEEFKKSGIGHQLCNIKESVEYFSKIANLVFEIDGNHVSMLHFLNDRFEPIDMLMFTPYDQIEKFIFWRMCAERIEIIDAKAVIFTSESWLRELNRSHSLNTPIKSLKIIGEKLSVYGVDENKNIHIIDQEIIRNNGDSKAYLLEPQVNEAEENQIGFLIPIIKALQSC